MKKWYKECPFCANEIKEKAIKCQYCWEFLNKEEENNEEEIKEEVKVEKKACPFCLNQIDEDATICPFCDENLNTANNEPIWDVNTEESEEFDEEKIIKSRYVDLSPKEKELKKSISYINTAFWWWCFSIVVSLIIYIINLTNDSNTILNVGLLDLIYSWVLVYFIYKRDRMAMLFFFIEFLLSSIVIVNSWNSINAFRIVIAAFLFMWIIWAFKYHSLTDQKELSKSEKIILIVWIIATIISIVWIIGTI